MVDRTSAPDLGSQDPALRNSPNAEEDDEETEALRQGTPAGPVCYSTTTRTETGCTSAAVDCFCGVIGGYGFRSVPRILTIPDSVQILY